jgi:hypothetical protein
MDDEKYLLANIGNIRACHTEPAQHPPNEGARVGENMVEIELGGEQDQGRQRFLSGVLDDGAKAYQSELPDHT